MVGLLPAGALSAMLELVAGTLLAAAVVAYVLRPIFQTLSPERARLAAAGGDEGDDPDDDLSARAVALRALKEIEFDRATGKLSDADYARLERQYTAEALAALRTADAPDAGPGPTGARTPADGERGPGTALTPACPSHGPRPERDAEFCSECGRRLATAPGFCAHCGVALERDARYCHACGARVAA